jgi:hypothetical protein
MQGQEQTISRSDITRSSVTALKLILAIYGGLLSSATIADINTAINHKQKEQKLSTAV